MSVERKLPPPDADERTMLEAWLDFHRATLERKCDGLTDEQLRTRSVDPSSLSLLGLVRHMAEVEKVWFRRRFRGEDAPPRYFSDDRPDDDFDDLESVPPAEVFADWRDQCERAREIVRAASLDEMSVEESKWAKGKVSLRWIVTHMIEEYARHNGHADLLRERIDGATGD